jgi:hypothetical protein
MKRFLATASIALSMTIAASSAKAGEYNTVYGSWTATFIQNNSAGLPACIASSKTSNGGMFMLKAQGNGSLFIDIFKDSWRLPLNAKVAVLLGFDSAYKFNSDAVVTENGQVRGVTFNVGADHLAELKSLIRNSRTMWVGFRTGNEPPWRIDMSGAAAVIEQWSMCTIAIMTGPEPSPTQPFAQQSAPVNPVQTVPIKKPKGDGI